VLFDLCGREIINLGFLHGNTAIIQTGINPGKENVGLSILVMFQDTKVIAEEFMHEALRMLTIITITEHILPVFITDITTIIRQHLQKKVSLRLQINPQPRTKKRMCENDLGAKGQAEDLLLGADQVRTEKGNRRIHNVKEGRSFL